MSFGIDSISEDPNQGLSHLRTFLTGAPGWVENAWSAGAGGVHADAQIAIAAGPGGTLTLTLPKPTGGGPYTVAGTTAVEIADAINAHVYMKWWVVAVAASAILVTINARFGGTIYNNGVGTLSVSAVDGVVCQITTNFANGTDVASDEFLYIKTAAASPTYHLFMCNTKNLAGILDWNNETIERVSNMLLWAVPILENDAAKNGWTSAEGPVCGIADGYPEVTFGAATGQCLGALGINDFVAPSEFPRSPCDRYNIGLTKSQEQRAGDKTYSGFYATSYAICSTNDRVVLVSVSNETQQEWLYAGAYTPHAGATYDDYPVIACVSRRFDDDFLSMFNSGIFDKAGSNADFIGRLAGLYYYKRGPVIQIGLALGPPDSEFIPPNAATHVSLPNAFSVGSDREYMIPGWNSYIPLIGGSQIMKPLGVGGGSTGGVSTFMYDVVIMSQFESMGLLGVVRVSEECPIRSEVQNATSDPFWVAYLSALHTFEGMRRKVAFQY